MALSKWALNGIILAKIEFWTTQYEFSFQFWGRDNNNVYINRDYIELASFGGEDSIADILTLAIEWCEKANPRKQYPKELIITNPQP